MTDLRVGVGTIECGSAPGAVLGGADVGCVVGTFAFGSAGGVEGGFSGFAEGDPHRRDGLTASETVALRGRPRLARGRRRPLGGLSLGPPGVPAGVVPSGLPVQRGHPDVRRRRPLHVRVRTRILSGTDPSLPLPWGLLGGNASDTGQE